MEIYAKRLGEGRLGAIGISDGWKTQPLGELIELLNGAPFDSNLFNRDGRGKPLIRIRDVGKDNTETWFSGDFDEKYLVTRGDVLVGLDGDFRVAEWHGTESLLNQRVCKLVPREDLLDKRFMLYHLAGWLDAIWEETSATTVKHLSSKTIQEIPFPVPPIEEQRRIVEALDDHLSRLDKALVELETADSQTYVFRRSLLNAFLNPQVTDSGPGTERLRQLPHRWSIAPLGEIADTQLGKMLNRSNQIGDATVPYLRNLNVQWGRVDLNDVKKMDIYPDEVNKFMAEPGDLLVCEGGESGRAAIWNGSSPIGIQNALHRVRPKTGISTRYLLYYFEWQVKSRMIDHLLSGVTITHFTQEKLRRMLVQYPPLEEQERIVEALDEQLSRLDSARTSIASQKTRIANLRRSTLNKAFIGKLGTN
jgi:type I restriction enzyme S subunit